MARRKKQNEEDAVNENLQNESDDSFGLPEIEYEPIRNDEEVENSTSESTEETPEPEPQEEQPYAGYESAEQEEEQPVEESTYSYSSYREEASPVWPKVLGILLVIVLALGATWYFVIYQPKEKERIENERLAEAQRLKALKDKQEQEKLAEQARLAAAAEQRRLDSLAAAPKEGAIETLTDRTGRYYVVVASALDQDLLMDYAKKLSSEGVSSKIIPPFGKHKVSRISIAEGDSFDAAQTTANGLKAEYGDAVWVLKY
ncbi:MAG: SPOR domain-containing protein [Cyclobacteriaceae bacterium]|nr:SPOR domain-containing protein [Cyclobacteriaceae bacterium]